MRLLWLPSVLRAAGLQVVEVAGWQTRGSDTFNPRGIIVHATAGNRNATDSGELNVILNGSTSAPPPISQLMLGRTGVWYVVASGRCNHARVGWGGPFSGLGNTYLLGIEGCNNNIDEPWNSYDSYVRGVAAIRKYTGWDIAGHKEHQPNDKSDPTFSMNTFRAAVATAIHPPVPLPVPEPEQNDEDEVAMRVYVYTLASGANPTRWAVGVVSGGAKFWFEGLTQNEGTALALGADFTNGTELTQAAFARQRDQFGGVPAV